MKKILALLLAAALVSCLAACGGKSGAEEDALKEQAEKYLECMQSFDTETMKEMTASGDHRQLDQKMAILPEEIQDLVKDMAKDIAFSMGEISLEELTAEMSVEFSYKDMTAAMEAAQKRYYDKVSFMMGMEGFNGMLGGPGAAKSGSDTLEEDVNGFLTECIKDAVESEGVQTVTKTVTLEFVKYQGEWRVKNLSEDVMNVLTSNTFILSQTEE